jgi:hypothetical protein
VRVGTGANPTPVPNSNAEATMGATRENGS